MDYLSVKEMSEKWGITTRRIQVLCKQNRIDGAKRIGNIWVIPKAINKPTDARIKKSTVKDL
ncbi:MAG: hypothetical protein APF81_21855 [Desulfosporosinus sp. BRH_c37]|nr:MAG: hypothetical protein APF81_21855 [Desulfosporosinus sp. BRH_c37]